MKILVFCLFFSCAAIIDPLLYFAKDTNGVLTVQYGDTTDIIVKDIHLHNASIYVVYILNGQFIYINKYDTKGILKGTIQVGQEGAFRFENATQILWQEDAFYVPGYVYQDEMRHGAIKKYTYESLGLASSFADEGTFVNNQNNYESSFTCIVSAGAKYFVTGWKRIIEGETLKDSYTLIDFDHITGDVNREYQEQEPIDSDGNTYRMYTKICAHQFDQDYVVEGITYDNAYAFTFITPERQSITVNSLGMEIVVNGDRVPLVFNNILNVSEANDSSTGYIVDNTNKKIGRVDIRYVDGHMVAHASVYVHTVIDPFNVHNYPITLSSLQVLDNKLFIAGSLLTGEHESKVFVEVFNIDGSFNLSLDTTFLENGWVIDEREFMGNSPFSGLCVTKTDPISLLVGYRNTLNHIAGNFHIMIHELVKEKFLPFVF